MIIELKFRQSGEISPNLVTKNLLLDGYLQDGKKMGGSPGLVVMGGDSRSEGRGFKSQCRILDGHFFTLIVVKLY